jgi:putative nucleotidyltransferase with HDIG domain
MAFIPMTGEELRIGLYIRLECSWWNHPFAKSKFKIRSQKEIATLRGIKKVKLFYEPDLSDPEIAEDENSELDLSPHDDEQPNQSEFLANEKSEAEVKEEQIQACRDHAAQIDKGGLLYQQALGQAKMALKRISDGHVGGLKTADQIVKSFREALKDKDTAMALMDIMITTSPEDSFIAHSLNVSILAMMLGVEFEMVDDEVYALGLGALLHDIGKEQLPPGIRGKRSGFTKMEQNEWRRHASLGPEAVERFTAFPPESLEIITQHHERLNGSGFPKGLQVEQISRMAQIVMVVDEYENLSSRFNVERNLTPAEALSNLYNDGQAQGNGELSEEIIVALVKVFGVYPPGTFVELDDGSLGLVTGVNGEDRTKPRVMLCPPEVPRDEAMVIDLCQKECTIVQSVNPQELPDKAKKYFFSSRLAS